MIVTDSIEDRAPVTLEAAAPDEMPLLANLLELYQHDLSECFGVDVGIDGRFGYARLPLYWSEPERHFPFLIRSGPRLAGFALATLGSPVSDDPNVHDVAEFFVLRRYRRAGVGRQAAHLLWNRYRGPWLVRVFERNTAALDFWKDVIAAYAGSPVEPRRVEHNRKQWQVFEFPSLPRSGFGQ
jgi:predicted acetyltransferase